MLHSSHSKVIESKTRFSLSDSEEIRDELLNIQVEDTGSCVAWCDDNITDVDPCLLLS